MLRPAQANSATAGRFSASTQTMAQRTESGPYWAAKASLSTPASVGPTPTPMRFSSTIRVDMDTPRMRTCTRLWLRA